MYDSDLPTPNDDTVDGVEEPVADTELDAIAGDLDTVEAAMKALDADDFDGAETLAASLDDSTASSETDEPGGDDSQPALDSGTAEA